jgi:hypothetical protein
VEGARKKKEEWVIMIEGGQEISLHARLLNAESIVHLQHWERMGTNGS